MTAKKYVDAIVASKEETAKALAPARASEQQAALGLEIAQLKLEIQGAENVVSELKGSYPLDLDTILSAGDELALKSRRLSQLVALDVELF
jgi:hypothetical protein